MYKIRIKKAYTSLNQLKKLFIATCFILYYCIVLGQESSVNLFPYESNSKMDIYTVVKGGFLIHKANTMTFSWWISNHSVLINNQFYYPFNFDIYTEVRPHDTTGYIRFENNKLIYITRIHNRCIYELNFVYNEKKTENVLIDFDSNHLEQKWTVSNFGLLDSCLLMVTDYGYSKSIKDTVYEIRNIKPFEPFGIPPLTVYQFKFCKKYGFVEIIFLYDSYAYLVWHNPEIKNKKIFTKLLIIKRWPTITTYPDMIY